MPTLVPLPAPESAVIRPLRGIGDAALAQGSDGVAMRMRLLDVLHQWESRQSIERDEMEPDEITYSPVPAKSIVRKHVKFRFVGRGRPAPYPMDEDPE